MKQIGLGLALAVLVLASCGRSGENTPSAPSATPTGPPIPGFVLNRVGTMSSVRQLDAPASDIAIGTLCAAFGGAPEILVNNEAPKPAASFPFRFVAVTRDGGWVVWLSPSSLSRLSTAAPAGTVPGGADLAIVDQAVSVEPAEAYLACR